MIPVPQIAPILTKDIFPDHIEVSRRMANKFRYISLLLLAVTCCLAIPAAAAVDETNPPTTTTGTITTDAEGQADLLKWALKHADPDLLHTQADVSKKHKTPEAVNERAAELLHLANHLPTETQRMEEALSILHNVTIPPHIKLSALHTLAIVVEPVDNADHLLKMDGNPTATLVDLLGTSPPLEAAAARVLGVAASNNEPFQDALIARHPDVILRLVQLLSAAADDTVAAAIYAAGRIVRNSLQARELWRQARGGDVVVALVRGGPQVSVRSRKRAVALAGDLLLLSRSEGTMIDKEALAQALVSALEDAASGGGGSRKMALALIELIL